MDFFFARNIFQKYVKCARRENEKVEALNNKATTAWQIFHGSMVFAPNNAII